MKRKVMPNRLKYARINAGYSQKDVCDISGFISRNSLGNCETGYEYPGNKVLHFLPGLYKVSLDYLFCEDCYPTLLNRKLNTSKNKIKLQNKIINRWNIMPL